MDQIIFNSSLPRSGSTLLQQILAQNPRFHCSATSGVIELLYAARQNFTNMPEFKAAGWKQSQTGFLGFCLGGLEGFYAAITDKPVVVDKSRGWIFYYDWLKKFYPEAKVICCVRDLRGIVASMEKRYRVNPHLHEANELPAQMKFVTQEQRVTHWLNSLPLGLAINRLMDACHRKQADEFCFVRMEDLCSTPKETMAWVYKSIGQPYFEHDFDNVQQLVPEDDSHHDFYGDHQIKPG